jgi:Ser/Thr protein kinase RdoA (MazF antagonist)
MNDAVEVLIRRLERSLSLTYDASGSSAWPCRAGKLFRVRLGNRRFALKLYEQGYFNDAYLFGALATTPVPVPAIHACDGSGELVGKPWILMDWVEGNHQISDRRAVGQQVGRMLREIHAIPVGGAGARGPNAWEFPDWHTLIDVQAQRDRAAIGQLADSEANKAFYVSVVDEFVQLGRAQPNQPFLLHGDLGPDNIIVHSNRVVGLIDAGRHVGGNPLMDVSYLMNSRLGEGDGMVGLLEGYGVAGLDRDHGVMALRLYHWIGKLIHFNATEQREIYEQRRRMLLEFAVRHGLRSGSPEQEA